MLKNDLKEALERLEEIEFKQEAHVENVDNLKDFVIPRGIMQRRVSIIILYINIFTVNSDE